jgi:CBS domain-containing protein
MPNRDQGDIVMRTPGVLTVSAIFMLLSQSALAEEVNLPAPVLEWSFYILLIFAACVAIGISIFMKGRNGTYETMGSLLEDQKPIVHSIGPEVSVTECVRLMNEFRIGSMLVMEDGQLLGIFTERDAITRVLGAGLDPVSTDISRVMTKDPVWVTPSTTLEEAMGIVTNKRIRHLPVVENGRVLGVVSSGDLTHRLVEA